VRLRGRCGGRYRAVAVTRALPALAVLAVAGCGHGAPALHAASRPVHRAHRGYLQVREPVYAHNRDLDLRKVDWREVTIPGRVCRARRPIHLHGGTAFLKTIPHRWARGLSLQPEEHLRSGVEVDAGWTPVRYGEVDGKRGDEAALPVDCNNGGGTADGVLRYAWVVYSRRHRALAPIGVVTARVRTRPHQLPTTLLPRIVHRAIVVREAWYGGRDGTCCPSGRAVTRWTYSRGGLHPGATRVTRRPRS
jgi:hypothetical protein